MSVIFWTGFWVFLADQVTKYLVVHAMGLRSLGAIDVLPPFLNLRMAWNTGINFGLFSGNSQVARYGLVVLAVVIVAGVLWWIRRHPQPRVARICAGILVGGALGNAVDRVIYGAVADFLNMSCCGIANPYAFNVADVAIFAGALGLAVFARDENPA